MAMTATYAGDVSSQQAWDMLRDDERALLIDVRTRAEWTFVGVPVLSEAGKETILIEWQTFPTMARNPGFADQVAKAVADRGVDPSAPLLFLCRSGQRSRDAAIALTEAGYDRCFNIAGGFEGPPDGDGHRGLSDGWKASRLPWAQS
ncbi:MAG: rhodanese-like domain-containing protein [Pseudomonadota bacterium]